MIWKAAISLMALAASACAAAIRSRQATVRDSKEDPTERPVVTIPKSCTFDPLKSGEEERCRTELVQWQATALRNLLEKGGSCGIETRTPQERSPISIQGVEIDANGDINLSLADLGQSLRLVTYTATCAGIPTTTYWKMLAVDEARKERSPTVVERRP